jgi:D-alanyl-lipoteichoic acid acyltransferase DltB (MBOAT superfamily)
MDIVIGTGEIFGIKLPENFKEPFFSKDIGEFWRRWHITLGTWLKDYIFYPISISKTNLKLSISSHKHLPKFLADFIMMGFPLLFVWLIMGFWHGASFKYILYGLYYYVLMMIGILLKPLFNMIIKGLKIKTECFSYHLFQSLRTFILITIGMTIFRASTFIDAFNILGSIFIPSTEKVSAIANGKANVILIVVCTIILLIVDILKYKGVNIIKKINEQNLIFKYLVYLAIILFLLIFGIYGYGYNPSSFIYGEF